MLLSDYAQQDAVGLAELISQREVSAEEVREAALAAVARLNPKLNAVIETWSDETIPASGAFRGVPFMVKDIVGAAAGRRNELGSRLAQGITATQDSYIMTRFKRSGLVTVGRTTTPEFGTSTTTESIATGATRNPWDPSRNAGGSSGGSGAAVASGMVPVAHGTDGGGSIRVPAAINGIFGLKPSRGRVSLGPEVDEVWAGMAVQFALTRTVRDSAALLDIASGLELGEPYYAPPPPCSYRDAIIRPPGALRIALVCRPPNGRTVDAPIQAALDRTANLCASLGHQVEERSLELGTSWESFVHAHAMFWTTQTAGWIESLAAATGRLIDATTLEPVTLAEWKFGRTASALDLLGAFAVRNIVTRSVARHFADVDMVLTPTLPELPLPIGEYNAPQALLDALGWVAYVFDRSPFTALYNMTGQPAMSVPLGFDLATGLPIGMQFGTRLGDEHLLLQLAAQLEVARPWRDRVPAVWAGALCQHN